VVQNELADRDYYTRAHSDINPSSRRNTPTPQAHSLAGGNEPESWLD